ncbi:MAG: ATP-binding cassette domain-containing protein [Bacilli bacterium]
MLTIKNLSYSYTDGGYKRTIFEDVNYTFSNGKIYMIMGYSGSGKTTLLSLLSGLEKSNQGEVLYNNKNINEIGLSEFRRHKVAIVFQQYNLISYLNGIQNVLLDIPIQENDRVKKAIRILEFVGISEYKGKRNVAKLSGGEQQRIAIARAIASDADIIFADEPTGNLDKETSLEIMNIFDYISHELNKTVIMTTHNMELSEFADKKIIIKHLNINEF